MKKTNRFIFGILLWCTLVCASCKKYLDEKSDKTLTVAATITDAQSLLDESTMFGAGVSSAGAFSDDDYYADGAYVDAVSSVIPERELMIKWDPSARDNDANWKGTYQWIAQANVALETLAKISPDAKDISAYNLAKGTALFYRGFYHHQLAIVYGFPYVSSSASSDFGIVYKKTSDINDPTIRLSNKDSYDAIISDLKNSLELLPLNTNPVTRPSKVAAFGALARVYLSMSDYVNAGIYADSALRLNNSLMDYQSFANYSATSTDSPFPLFHVEDILHTTGQGAGQFAPPNYIVDSVLYASYDNNDLRKSLFFVKISGSQNMYSFRANYAPEDNSSPYSGIATDELYLTRAECYARQGNTNAALNDLNTLMVKRWKTGTFTNFTAATASDALKIILRERRKELIHRNNMRWSDLKRLNLDPNFAVTLRRTLKGVAYSLPPNDLRYQLLIPPVVIQASGIKQNPR